MMQKMLKFKEKVKNGRLFVKVRLPSLDFMDEGEKGLLLETEIEGLLKIDRQKRDTVIYVGAAGTPLSSYLAKKKLSKYELFHMMAQIVGMVRRISDKHLSDKRLAFHLSHVYVVESTKELQFLYLPVQLEFQFPEMTEFMGQILRALSPAEDAEKCVADYIDFLNAQKGTDLEAIERFISEEDADAAKQIGCYRRLRSARPSEDFEKNLKGEAVGLFDGEGTVLLPYHARIPLPSSCLTRLRDGEEISVNKAVFRLGARQGSVDYCIGGNHTVSRSHADIITRGQMRFIKDLNSTNHTYVNGERVSPGEEVPIFDGDILMLSDEEFEFHA